MVAEVTATVIRDPNTLGDLQEDSSEDEDLLLDNKIWGVYVKAMLWLCSRLLIGLHVFFFFYCIASVQNLWQENL